MAEIARITNPDGTITVYYDDKAPITVGTPIDRVALARQRAQEARTFYDDPWIRENLLDPQNRATAEAKQQWDKTHGLNRYQAKTSRMSVTNQAQSARDQIEMRKLEMRQNGELETWKAIIGLRGPGNAAQFIDAAERAPRFQAESGFMRRMVTPGGQPSRAPGASMSFQPTSAQAVAEGSAPAAVNDGPMTAPGSGGPGGAVLGAMGAPSAGDVSTRHANDLALAGRIAANPRLLARGSVESLGKFRQAYLGSYIDAGGGDEGSFLEAYDAAGMKQGRRR